MNGPERMQGPAVSRADSDARALGRRAFVRLAAMAGVGGFGLGARAAETAGAEASIPLGAGDRVAVLAPHPDDEAIGCGGIVRKALAAGAAVRVVFLTYGDCNEWSFALYRERPVLTPSGVRGMGLLRHDEAVRSCSELGLPAGSVIFLGYPDFGTHAIWKEHWGDAPPARGLLTRATSVPYANALRPGAPFKGEEILRDLEQVLGDFRPTRVFLSHPADHNPDHRALYLFARVALWNLEGRFRSALHPYLVHFPRWPVPRGRHPDAALAPPEAMQGQVVWTAVPLSPAEIARKEVALRCHRTQLRYAAGYLDSFIRPNELFGDFDPVRPAGAESGTVLDTGRNRAGEDEELLEDERASFLGLERRVISVDKDMVVLEVFYDRPLAKAVELEADLFGYRPDRPFVDMPKFTVRAGAWRHTVSQFGRPVRGADVRVRKGDRSIEIRVPLEDLGRPVRLLSAARTRMGDVPLDWMAWRIIELPAAEGVDKKTGGAASAAPPR